MNYKFLLSLTLLSFNLSARIPKELLELMRANAIALTRFNPQPALNALKTNLQNIDTYSNESNTAETIKTYHEIVSSEVFQLHVRKIREIKKECEIRNKLFAKYPHDEKKLLETVKENWIATTQEEYESLMEKIETLFDPYLN